MEQTFQCPLCGRHMEVKEYITEPIVFDSGINLICDDCNCRFNVKMKIEKVYIVITNNN